MTSMCVGNTEIKNCIFGKSTSCPGAETLEVLHNNELDMTIEYKQWVMTEQLS
jgi:hypothetical protein